jgi:hypothetical protein
MKSLTTTNTQSRTLASTGLIAIALSALAVAGCDTAGKPAPRGITDDASAFNLTQTVSDAAQRTTLAFSALAMITGNLDSQSFFPPGKVADYTGFQHLRDNDPDGMGHNTSFLTRVACDVIYILDASQLKILADLAAAQQASFLQYGWDRYPLMQAFRRLIEGSLPPGTTGLSESAVVEASKALYLIDGRISYDRAVAYSAVIDSLREDQKAFLAEMVGKGWDSWPDHGETDATVVAHIGSLGKVDRTALYTYAGDIFSWYAGDIEADAYFCPERQGTYFGSFYMKDAPAVGVPGYGISTELTATAGAALCDASKGYVTTAQAATICALVGVQRDNLYAGAASIVSVRREISSLLRELRASADGDGSILDRVLELSETYGRIDGENNYHYATAIAEVSASLTAEQEAGLAALRASILSGSYDDGTLFDFTTCATPYLYSAPIKDAATLSTYISDAATDGFFE